MNREHLHMLLGLIKSALKPLAIWLVVLYMTGILPVLLVAAVEYFM